jgi:16S rRNA G966 N2-methylase RsmD
MNIELLNSIRSGGYLPKPEDPSDIFWRLSRSNIGSKLPQSPIGTRYLDNVFPHRFKSKTTGFMSFDEAFNDNLQLQRAINYVLMSGRDPEKDIILKNLNFNVHVPSHFFPDTSAALCNHFAPGGNIYDAFTGWGGRSLGAICSNSTSLTSTDLQIESINSGRKMAKDFSSISKTNCSFIHDDFSSFMESTDSKFDLIIASPPFLNTEDYGNHDTRTLREWLCEIAIPLSSKCKRILKHNGLVAIHGQDRPNVPVLSIIYTAFSCSGYNLKHEFKYGKKIGQSVLIWSYD